MAASVKKTQLPRFLENVTVLDLTNVLSGPFAGYLLTLLGARTIKIEHPGHGDLARSMGASPQLREKKMGTGFLAQNAGKQSLAVDLKQPEGKEVFLKLVSQSDVVLENFRPGVMARLGLNYETLVTHKPDLVYCAISGYGQEGPDAKKPAFDQIIQGKCGIMDVTGTQDSGPLRCGIPVADMAGGLQAALAVMAALYHRLNSGQGHFIDISLLDAALPMMGWVASNYLLAGMEPERMGNENATTAPSGAFQTRSGLLNIAANTEEQWQNLCRALKLPELIKDPRFVNREERRRHRAVLAQILEDRLKTKSAATWEQDLNDQGVPCGEVLTFFQALNHPQVKARNIVGEVVSQLLGTLKIFGLSADFDHTSQRFPADLAPPPFLGEHSHTILKELNYSERRIDQLIRRKVVACRPRQ